MGETIRTTIVGGRPPAQERSLGEVPRGVEILLKKASVDKAFRDLLLADPEQAARGIALELTNAERRMLRSVGPAALAQMISRVRVPKRQRSLFLGKAAAVMLAALGASLVGCGEAQATRGISPDKPPKKQENTENEDAATNVAPDAPATPPVAASTGIRSDRPQTRGHSADRPPAR